MSLGNVIAGAAAAWWIGGTAVLSVSLFGALLQPRIQRRRAVASALPPISLILPIKLANPGYERAQASALTQDHPDHEVIVGCAESESPALATMRGLIAESGVPVRILHTRGIGAVSPKLDNLAGPIDIARHDVMVTKDSNMTFAPDTLRALARHLTPGVGLVCAIPVAVRAKSFAGRIEATIVNRDARMLLTASACGKGFGVGKVMLFRRSDLRRAGGLEAMAYTIAEDSALSKGLAAIGLRSVFTDTGVDQEIGARSLADVYARQARWAVIRRSEEPAAFALEPLACPLPAALAGAVAAPLLGMAPLAAFAATLLGWYLIETAFVAAKGWEVGPWRPVVFLGRDVVHLAAWASGWTTRTVTWAGRTQCVSDARRRPGGRMA